MSVSQCTKWGRTVLKRLVFQKMAAGLILIAGGNHALQAMPAIWINEIHYDNSGADMGEGVEIAGVAGTVIDDYRIELYNGSAGDVYQTITLSGIIPDQENGFGTLSFAVSGMQNGAPDGLALADPTFNPIQFLSYEGTFAATEGSALGMVSIELPVSETTSTPLGFSLQLIGTGMSYDDFTWSGPFGETFGSINTGQQFLGEDPNPDPPMGNSVPDGGSSLAFLSLVFLGLMYRPSRQGDSGMPGRSTPG